MSGVNKVILVGRLGADPELKTISTGNQVARLSIATSESWNDKNGQKQERTEWHRVVVWGKLAELCAKYLSKGRMAYVEGRLQTRKYDDAQGQTKYSTEIVATTVQFLGGAGDHRGASSEQEESMDFGPEPAFHAGDGGGLPF